MHSNYLATPLGKTIEKEVEEESKGNHLASFDDGETMSKLK